MAKLRWMFDAMHNAHIGNVLVLNIQTINGPYFAVIPFALLIAQTEFGPTGSSYSILGQF